MFRSTDWRQLKTIGRKILQEYDRALLEGPPKAIPIEDDH